MKHLLCLSLMSSPPLFLKFFKKPFSSLDSHWCPPRILAASSLWHYGYNSVNNHCFVYEPHISEVNYDLQSCEQRTKSKGQASQVCAAERFFCMGLDDEVRVCMNGEHRKHVWPNSHPKWLDWASQSSMQGWDRVKSFSQSTVQMYKKIFC